VRLEDLPVDEAQFVPTFLHNIFKHLLKTAVTTEGILRVSPSTKEVEVLVGELNQGTLP
jgi:hypothetical protein